MTIYIGSNNSVKIFAGSKQPSKIYRGETLIFNKEGGVTPPIEDNYLLDKDITMIAEQQNLTRIENLGAYSRKITTLNTNRYTYVKIFTKRLPIGRYKFTATTSGSLLGFSTKTDLYEMNLIFEVGSQVDTTVYVGMERNKSCTISNIKLEKVGEALPPRPPFVAPSIENVREVYTNRDDGREKTIIWVKGLKKPPKISDFRYSNMNGYITYDIPFTLGQGWYDANKDERVGDDSLCFVAATVNSLYWWFDINKDYIQRFFDEGGTIPKDDGTKLAKLKEIINSPRPQRRSALWEYFYDNMFGGKESGGFTDVVHDCFLNGYWIDNPRTNNKLWGMNSEENQGQRVLNEGIDTNGGFFNEVLNIRRLTDRQTFEGIGIEDYTRTIRNTIERGGIVLPSLYYSLFGGASHVITMWGAEFNNDDNTLSAIYVSDSDDTQNNETMGMERRMISTKDGVIKMTTQADGRGGAKVYQLYTLMAGTELWEDYFRRK